MKEILIGFLSGVVSGTGMGGGTILILCLNIFFGINQKVAQATNLIFFIPTSIVAIVVNVKNKKIDLNVCKVVIIFGIIGAILGAIISKNIEVNMLKKFFGYFLIIITIREIYSLIREYKIKDCIK